MKWIKASEGLQKDPTKEVYLKGCRSYFGCLVSETVSGRDCVSLYERSFGELKQVSSWIVGHEDLQYVKWLDESEPPAPAGEWKEAQDWTNEFADLYAVIQSVEDKVVVGKINKLMADMHRTIRSHIGMLQETVDWAGRAIETKEKQIEELSKEKEQADDLWKRRKADVEFWKKEYEKLCEELLSFKKNECPKCGYGAESYPKWQDWQENILPVLTRFGTMAHESLYYGDVWKAIRKFLVTPLTEENKRLQSQISAQAGGGGCCGGIEMAC